MLDPELSELIPVFTEEVRERLERLATLAPQLGRADGGGARSDALDQVRRELHTVKGAARMLQVGAVAELCHAAEELLDHAPEGHPELLVDTVDTLSAMVETVAAGELPRPDPELLARLAAALAPDAPPEAAAPEEVEEEVAGADAPGAGAAGAPAGPEASDGSGSSGEGEGGEASESDGGGDGDDEMVAVGVAEVADVGELGGRPTAEPAASDSGGGERRAGGDVRVDAAALDAVADQATQVRILSLATRGSVQRLYDLAKLAEGGLREPQPKQVLAVLATMLRRLAVDVENGQRRLLRSSEEGLDRLLTLQLQPLRGTLVQLARYARELARSLGREVEVAIEGEETRLDRRIARELEESLIHLVRNAVDHGIEAPAARRAAGKDEAGRIRLTAEATGGRVRLTITDDGAGIDRARILAQAERAGLVDAATAATLSREEVYRLLFTPGFSTRRQVSEISGRGVGLDVVASAVNRAGGEVFLSAEPGRGTTVSVEVPVARRGEQVLVVKVGSVRLALPATPIRRVLKVHSDLVIERDGRSFLEIDGRLTPFVPLAGLFAQPAAEEQLLLVGRVSGQPLALAVDAVEGEQELLVRPMARAAEVPPIVDGMALLASGDPIAVLSPIQLAKRGYGSRGRTAPPVVAEVERVRVLLVDDSLVTREMERRLLEDAGFRVTAASDAEEGLNFLGEEHFDCLVTDIEMPGMDGYELTRHLRQIPQFAQLPIVVVSTRDRPEDRLAGLQAGADAYLTKQSLDAGELVDIVRRLSGTR